MITDKIKEIFFEKFGITIKKRKAILLIVFVISVAILFLSVVISYKQTTSSKKSVPMVDDM